MSEQAPPAVWIGQVTDRDDPKQLGRVRVRVPGLVEPQSAWALPLGGSGGGSRNRGLFMVPDVKASVGLLFEKGDPDGQPYYLGGPWAAEAPEAEEDPDQSEIPLEARSSDKPQDVAVWSDESFAISINTEKKLLTINDRANGSFIEMDAATGSLNLVAKTKIQIQAGGQVDIDAVLITIKGRRVLTAKPTI